LTSKSTASLALGLLVLASACSRGAATRDYKGAEITITKTSRTDGWQDYVTGPDHEFFVVDLQIDAESLDDVLQISEMRLVNLDGSVGETPIKRLELSGGSVHQSEVGFAVPKGAEPSRLEIGDAVFDLTQLAEQHTETTPTEDSSTF
jgi:hypothetical protein